MHIEHSLQVLLLLTTSQHDNSCPSVTSAHPACSCHTLRTPVTQMYSSCRRQAPPREFFTPPQMLQLISANAVARQTDRHWPRSAQEAPRLRTHLLWHRLWVAGSSNTSGINAEHHRLEKFMSPMADTMKKEDYKAHFSSSSAQGKCKFCCLICTELWNS